MKSIYFPLLLGIFCFALSAKLFSETKKGLKSHEHGVASLQMAIEDKIITFILESPAEVFLGFEHDAKTESEKKAKAEALEILKNRFSELVILDKSLQCKISNTHLEIDSDDDDDHDEKDAHSDHKKSNRHIHEHRDLDAEWKAVCLKSPLKSRALFQFSHKFHRINELHINIISDQKQSREILKKGNGEINI